MMGMVFLTPIQVDLESRIKALQDIIVKSSVEGATPTDKAQPGKSKVHTCMCKLHLHNLV